MNRRLNEFEVYFMLLDGEKICFDNYTNSGYELSEEEINAKYQDGEMRIITESGRYPLQNIVAILSNNVKFDPEYQRRRVWNVIQKSRLIESFIMNVPIPPVFLYEIDFSKYEVMDGLQRLSTVYEYYTDKFALNGLEVWPELNGKKYSELPKNVKSGIDRRYISTIVILKETAKTEEEEHILKKFVFERLNTGGTKLTDQETRNALIDGPMNKLCIEIANNCAIFHKLWHIKPYKEINLLSNGKNTENEEIDKDKNIYMRMEDVELVLRYFAYRQLKENPSYKVKDILDTYLKEANCFSDDLLSGMRKEFEDVLELAYKILGSNAFSMYTKKKNGGFSWNKAPSKLVYDPMLMALTEYINDKNKMWILIKNRDVVKGKIADMFKVHEDAFDGRNSSKSEVLHRKLLYSEIFNTVVQEFCNE